MVGEQFVFLVQGLAGALCVANGWRLPSSLLLRYVQDLPGQGDAEAVGHACVVRRVLDSASKRQASL